MTNAITWGIAPLTATPAMIAAAETARTAGASFAEQYQAAMQSLGHEQNDGLTSDTETDVTYERGEELVADLEAGMASPVAKDLYQQITAGNKDRAMRILDDERMTGQAAEDLYSYCRHKWVGGKLALVEVPLQNAEALVREVNPDAATGGFEGPRYLIREGRGVAAVMATMENGHLQFWKSGRGLVDLKSVQQLWMIA